MDKETLSPILEQAKIDLMMSVAVARATTLKEKQQQQKLQAPQGTTIKYNV